jgi:hypothetical protein
VIHDVRPSFQSQYDSRLQGGTALMTANNYEQTAPVTKMLVGPWYLDEFADSRNQTTRLAIAKQFAEWRVPSRPTGLGMI